MALVTEQRARNGSYPRLRAAIRFMCRHWLFAINVVLIAYATIPFLAPVFAALGVDRPANVVYYLYSFTCDQIPSHSYFLFGHQMAICERCTAIYLSMVASGLAYVRLRNRHVRPLPWYWYLAMIFPMALDGFTQLFGWRESTWYLRGITGILFGVASVWLTFPYLQESFDEIERTT